MRTAHAGTNGDGSSSDGEIIYTPPETNPTEDSPATPMASETLVTASRGEAPVEAQSEANISAREYIFFLPFPLPAGTPVPYSIGLPNNNPLGLPNGLYEPTSTLVLTSPNRTFVDIRLLKPLDPFSTLDLPNHGETWRLDWAFTGKSSSVPITKPGWQNVTHATWMHWVDSRYTVGTQYMPIDEGDMYTIDDERSLEHGHAYHPSLKAIVSHEEMWKDVPVLSTNERGTKICAVMRVQDDVNGVRGAVIRVGQYVQGIIMFGARVSVERWEFMPHRMCGGDERTGWTRIARTGSDFLPCAVFFRTDVVAVGGVVKFLQWEWSVTEAWEW